MPKMNAKLETLFIEQGYNPHAKEISLADAPECIEKIVDQIAGRQNDINLLLFDGLTEVKANGKGDGRGDTLKENPIAIGSPNRYQLSIYTPNTEFDDKQGSSIYYSICPKDYADCLESQSKGFNLSLMHPRRGWGADLKYAEVVLSTKDSKILLFDRVKSDTEQRQMFWQNVAERSGIKLIEDSSASSESPSYLAEFVSGIKLQIPLCPTHGSYDIVVTFPQQIAKEGLANLVSGLSIEPIMIDECKTNRAKNAKSYNDVVIQHGGKVFTVYADTGKGEDVAAFLSRLQQK